MSKIEELAEKNWQKQINPETTNYECFFHYNDKMIFESGFMEGYKTKLPMAYFVELTSINNPTTMTDEEFKKNAHTILTLENLSIDYNQENLPNDTRNFLRILQ